MEDCAKVKIINPEIDQVIGTMYAVKQKKGVAVEIRLRTVTPVDFFKILMTSNANITIDSETCVVGNKDTTYEGMPKHNGFKWFTACAYVYSSSGALNLYLTFWSSNHQDTMRMFSEWHGNKIGWAVENEGINKIREVQPIWRFKHSAWGVAKVGMKWIAPWFGLSKLTRNSCFQCPRRLYFVNDFELIHYTLVDHLVPWVLSNSDFDKDSCGRFMPCPGVGSPIDVPVYLAQREDGTYPIPLQLPLVKFDLEYADGNGQIFRFDEPMDNKSYTQIEPYEPKFTTYYRPEITGPFKLCKFSYTKRPEKAIEDQFQQIMTHWLSSGAWPAEYNLVMGAKKDGKVPFGKNGKDSKSLKKKKASKDGKKIQEFVDKKIKKKRQEVANEILEEREKCDKLKKEVKNGLDVNKALEMVESKEKDEKSENKNKEQVAEEKQNKETSEGEEVYEEEEESEEIEESSEELPNPTDFLIVPKDSTGRKTNTFIFNKRGHKTFKERPRIDSKKISAIRKITNKTSEGLAINMLGKFALTNVKHFETKMGKEYVLVEMPDGHCFDFARLACERIWKPANEPTTPISEIGEFCTWETGEELWLTLEDNETFHVNVLFSSEDYIELISWLETKMEGIGILTIRESLSEGKDDTFSYHPEKGFQKQLGANVSNTLIQALTRNGMKPLIVDATRNQKLTQHGGHEDIRRLVDVFHCRTWNSTLAYIASKEPENWIDIGSKFMSLTRMLTRNSLATEEYDVEVNFIPIRTDLGEYNEDYIVNHLDNYKRKVQGKSAIINYQGTFIKINFQPVRNEFFRLENTTDEDVITFTDAHYYNAANPMKGRKFFSGIMFPELTGIYRAPNEECTIEITYSEEGGNVKMQTNSNGTLYDHPLVTAPVSKIASLDSEGFFRFFCGTSNQQIFVKRLMVPRQFENVDWAFETLNATSTTQTLNSKLALSGFSLLDYMEYKPKNVNYFTERRKFEETRANPDIQVCQTVRALAAKRVKMWSSLNMWQKTAICSKSRPTMPFVFFGAATYAVTTALDFTQYSKGISQIYIQMAKNHLSTMTPVQSTLGVFSSTTATLLENYQYEVSVALNEGIAQVPIKLLENAQPKTWSQRIGDFFSGKSEVELKREKIEAALEVTKKTCKNMSEKVSLEEYKALNAFEKAQAPLEEALKDLKKNAPSYINWTNLALAIGLSATLYLLYPTIKAAWKDLTRYLYDHPDEELSEDQWKILKDLKMGAKTTHKAHDFSVAIDWKAVVEAPIDPNLLREIDLAEIRDRQPKNFINTTNEFLKVEKPLPIFKVNKNMIEESINWKEFCLDYNAEGFLIPQPPVAGFQVLTENGIVNPHCYEPRSLVNLAVALFDRQLGTLLSPNTLVIIALKRFVEEHLEAMHFEMPETKHYLQWIREHDNWNSSKKRKYNNNILVQLGDNYDDYYFKNEFSAMVKNLEVYNSSNPLMDSFVLEGVKDRPRIIMDPNESLCGVITWMQQMAFSIFKDQYPEFVHAENSQDFWKRTWPEIRSIKNAVCFSMDGGSHDSHQHASLIRAVDHQIWRKMSPLIKDFLEKYKAKNPDRLHANLMDILLSTIAKVNLKGLKGKKYGYIKINGTVFSGSPTLTTFGNTMRVIFCHLFCLSIAKVPKDQYCLRVAGDDAVLWINKDYEKDLERIYSVMYSDNKSDHSKGLGQILEYSKNEWWRAEFCSKMLVVDPNLPEKAHWVRKPESVLYKGHRYFGYQEDLKIPENYSKVWASGLLNETAGPIYRQLGLIRESMGRESISEDLTHKVRNFVCKNEEDEHLDIRYRMEFSFWQGCSMQATTAFEACLDNILKYFEKTKVPIGTVIPDPRLFDF